MVFVSLKFYLKITKLQYMKYNLYNYYNKS